MRIYTKVTLDWDGNVLEEEFYDYEGPVALAGGGGGSNTTNTVQKADPWAGQQPYLRDIFAQAQQLNNSSGPQLYPGQTVAGLAPSEQLAQQYAFGAAQSEQMPMVRQAADANQFLLGDVLRADSNPYMADYAKGAISPIFEELRQSTLPAIRSGAIASGQFGGGAQRINEALAIDKATQNALNTTSQIYSDAYGQNLEALQRGVALAPQTASSALIPAQTFSAIGSQNRAYEQALMDDAARRFEYEQQLPWNKLAAYQGLVQGNFGGTGIATSTGGSSGGSSLLGAAGAGLSTYGAMSAIPALAPIAPWAAGGVALLSLFS